MEQKEPMDRWPAPVGWFASELNDKGRGIITIVVRSCQAGALVNHCRLSVEEAVRKGLEKFNTHTHLNSSLLVPSCLWILFSSVADPDLDPYDPYIFGSSESGSYRQAKIVRKTLIPIVLRLLNDFLSLRNDVNVPSLSNKQKNLEKIAICWRLEGQLRKWLDPEPDLDPLV